MALDSCFVQAGFTAAVWLQPEPSSPQADTVELTAYFFKLIAAFTSRSCSALQTGQVHCRTASGKASSLSGFVCLWSRRLARLGEPSPYVCGSSHPYGARVVGKTRPAPCGLWGLGAQGVAALVSEGQGASHRRGALSMRGFAP